MKKFLVICFSIIILVTIGFMMVFFISSNELYELKDKNWENKSIIINSEHKIQIELNNAEPNTTAEDFKLTVANDEVVQVLNKNGVPAFENGATNGQKLITFNIKAISAGETTLTIHFNSKNSDQPNRDLAVKVADGSLAYPFVITNFGELSQIGRDQSEFGLNHHYILGNNITAEGNWKTIPGEFNGSFNGNNNTISHISLNENSANAGFFETIGAEGKVYNLNISDFTANGEFAKIGALASTNKGTCYRINVSNSKIENSYLDGITGGIFGENTSADAQNSAVLTLSTFEGNITTTNNGIIGGLVGLNQGSTVGYSYVKAGTTFSAPATSKLGGLVGVNSFKYSPALVADCYSLAEVNESQESRPFFGGTIGSHEYAVDNVNITYGCYYLTGKNFNQSIGSHSDFDGDALNASVQSIEKGIYVAKGYNAEELKVKANFKSYKDYSDMPHDWDFTNIWSMPSEQTPKIIASTFKKPSPSSLKAPNTIQDFDDFFDPNVIDRFDNFVINHDIDCGGIVISDKIYNADGTILSDKCIILDQKIIKSGKPNNEPVRIFNFTIKSSNSETGFFSIIDESTLENLTFQPNKFIINEDSTKIQANTNSYNFGVLAGAVVSSTLSNVSIDLTYADFNGASKLAPVFENKTLNIGVMAGQLSGSTLNNCVVNGKNELSTISTQSAQNKLNRNIKLGGIAGISHQSQIKNSTVQNVYLHDIDSFGGSLGGIVGEILYTVSDSTLVNCSTSNTKLESLTNTNLENNGSNKDGHYTGGIVGYVTIDAYRANIETIYHCFSNSEIKGHYVGGIAGRTYGNISRSTSNSIITGWKVGGIAGFQVNKSRISNCLVNGKLIQSNELRNSYKISNSNTENKGISNSAQIAGISALAIGISNYDDVPHMENCFVNCEMEGSNQFKDSAVNKRVTGSAILGIFGNQSYRNYTWSGTIKNCVFNTHKAPNAKNRFEFSDDSWVGNLGEKIFNLSYDYSITDFNGTNWNAFNSFDKENIWNIDSNNSNVSIR